jgi:biotin synthase-related radical SAM superfamily protein
LTRVCTVCTHPDLDEINRLLARNERIADIARKYALSWNAVDRHKDAHLPENIIVSPSANEMTQADNLLSQIEEYKVEIGEMKDQARAEGNIELALKAVDRALKCIELQSKVRGLIDKQPQINVNTQLNIFLSSEWKAVGDLLARNLVGYPELRSEIARVLLALARGSHELHAAGEISGSGAVAD